MPRGGGARSGGGGGGFGGRAGGGGGGFGSRGSSTMPRQPSTRTPTPPARRSPPAGRKDFGGGRVAEGGGRFGKWGGSEFKRTVAASFLGSALGSIVGNAIAAKMFAGRDPDTGQMVDESVADDNPCKQQLDYFLECAKYAQDPVYCKGASDALKKCADEHKDYFAEE